MENNYFFEKTARFTRQFFIRHSRMKYIFLLAYLFLFLAASAQKINKDYLFYPQETGNIYFIFPQKGFSSTDETDKKGLVYDITYLTSDDSITFSFTYINQEIRKPERMAFLTADGQILYRGKTHMLFVQPRKKHWEHRVAIKVPYKEAIRFYAQEQPGQLQVYTNKKEILYQITPGNWKKHRLLTNRIFEIITNNN